MSDKKLLLDGEPEQGLLAYFCKFFNIELKSFSQSFKDLFFLGLIYIFPFLITNIYFLDDSFHAERGIVGLKEAARPVADWISIVLNSAEPFSFSRAVIDLAPLPQLISLLLLAASAAVLACCLFSNKTNIYTSLVVFPIIANPFFLENLSYKFTNLAAPLCLFFAILACLTTRRKAIGLLLSCLFLILSLTTYQIGLNIFIATNFLIFFSKFFEDQKESFKFLLNKSYITAIATVLYYIFFVFLGPVKTGYFASHSTIVSFDYSGFTQVLKNLWSSYQVFENTVLSSVFLKNFLIFSLLTFVYKEFLHNGIKARKDIFKILVFLISALAMLVSLNGFTLLLANPTFEARIYISFAVVLIFASYLIYNTFDNSLSPFRRILIIPTIFFIFTSYIYVGALRSQVDYSLKAVTQIKTKLDDLGINKKHDLIFDGSYGWSRNALNAKRNPLINYILSGSLNMQSEWNTKVLLKQQKLDFNNLLELKKEQILDLCQIQALYKNSSFRIFQNQGLYIVSFKNGVCFKVN